MQLPFITRLLSTRLKIFLIPSREKRSLGLDDIFVKKSNWRASAMKKRMLSVSSAVSLISICFLTILFSSKCSPQKADKTSDKGSTGAALAGTIQINGSLNYADDPENNLQGGTPAAGAKVYVEQNPSISGVTQPNGAFTIAIDPNATKLLLADQTGLKGGQFAVIGEQEKNGKKFMVRQDGLMNAGGGSINLGTLELKETGAIKGNVKLIDKEDHIGSEVYVPGTSFIAKTDRNGDFFILYIPEGKYELVGEKDDYQLTSFGTFRVVSKKVTYAGDFVLDTYDTTPPDTSLVTKPNTSSNSTTAVFEFSSTERNSSFMCSLDDATPSSCTTPMAYANLSDSEHRFAVYAIDRSGNLDASPAEYTWTIDATPPQSTYVLIGTGRAYTNSQSVNLTLGAVGASQMRFSATGDFTDVEWIDYATSATYALSAEEGTKHVYVEFRDAAGNVAPVSHASIEFDSSAPVPANPAIVLAGAALFTNSVSLTVSLDAANAAEMQVAENEAFDGKPWLSYVPTTTFLLSSGDGLKTVSTRFRDAAGNVTDPVSSTITLDTTPPTIPLIQTTSQVTSATSVTVNLVGPVTETNFDRYEIAGYDGCMSSFCSATSNKNTTQFTLTLAANSENRILIRAIDKANNKSSESFVVMTMDNTRPSPPTSLKADTGDNSVRLTWSSVTDAANYKVYFAHSGDTTTFVPSGSPGVSKEGRSPIVVGKETQTFTLSNIGAGTLYIMVSSVDEAGNESEEPTSSGATNTTRVSVASFATKFVGEYLSTGKGQAWAVDAHRDIMVVAERCSYDIHRLCNGQTDGGVSIVDISNPSSPVEMARCSSATNQGCGLSTPIADATDIKFDGQYAYVAAGAGGVVVLDLTNPTAPTKASECLHDNTCLPTGGIAWALDVKGGMIFVADGPKGFRTIDNRNPKYMYTNRLTRCTGVDSSTCASYYLNGGGSPNETDADGALAFHAQEADEHTTRCHVIDVEVSGYYALITWGTNSDTSVDTCVDPTESTGKWHHELLKLYDDATAGAADATKLSGFYPKRSISVAKLNGSGSRGRVHISGDLVFVNNGAGTEVYEIGSKLQA